MYKRQFPSFSPSRFSLTGSSFIVAVFLFICGIIIICARGITPVSYTHLDVYKRQPFRPRNRHHHSQRPKNRRNRRNQNLQGSSARKPHFRRGPERVRYVLANTIQQKGFDGRIPQPLKEWAKSVDVCSENASRFLVDKPNPGLTALFVDAFRQQTEAQKEVTSEKTEERDPEVVAWESDEITSIEVKTVEVKPPVVPLPEEAAQAPKAHRLTAEEKELSLIHI